MSEVAEIDSRACYTCAFQAKTCADVPCRKCLFRDKWEPEEADVNTVEAKDLHQFTEQQIEDCCAKLDKMCLAFHSERTAMVMALQIIRQLQEPISGEVRHPIGPDDKPDKTRTYCYSCGTTVRDQKHCHGCGRKLDWAQTTNQQPFGDPEQSWSVINAR